MLKSIGRLLTLLAMPAVLLASSGRGSVAAEMERLPYANSKITPPTDQWCQEVEKAAPAQPTVPAEKRKVLVFSLFTGYNHRVIPHVDRVMEILGRRSGAYEAVVTRDSEQLAAENLQRYDVLVLNNNCSKGPRRNLFLDELERNEKYKDLSDEQRRAKAEALEDSVLGFVAGGGGLVAIHGAPTMLNNSKEFTSMVGGAFAYHPPNQAVTIRPIEPDHPLLASFEGTEALVHRDEPYCFDGPYERLDFRPLLAMDAGNLRGAKKGIDRLPRYVAWIRPHGEGRVFYCSPSHFPASYKSPTLLQLILDGIQYAAGDLKCDDSTPARDG